MSTFDSILTINDTFQTSTLQFPKGVIMAYYPINNLNQNIIPKGWAICDGTNGTPDLRGRFILAYGKKNKAKYPFGAHGGTDTKRIRVNNMPKHTHSIYIQNASCRPGDRDNDGGYPEAHLGYQKFWMNDCPGVLTISSKNISSKMNVTPWHPQNNSPPYYAMLYIMKMI